MKQWNYLRAGAWFAAAVFAAVLWRAFSLAREPFEFMVAGTGLTAAALLVAFVVVVRRQWAVASRVSGRRLLPWDTAHRQGERRR